MAKYKVEFDRELCVGAIACSAVAEDFYIKSADGKVDLAGSAYNEQTKKWELIIDEKDYAVNDDALSACPVAAIKITKIESQNQEAAQGQNSSQNIQKEKELTQIQSEKTSSEQNR
jgi:ferredoxin